MFRPSPLRTPETNERYRKYAESRSPDDRCPLCAAETLVDFDHWRIIDNAFPYDEIAEVHHLLIPKAHISHREKNFMPIWGNFAMDIEKYVFASYDAVTLNCPAAQTVPDHMHFHLITYKTI